jgi:hypothetical protein
MSLTNTILRTSTKILILSSFGLFITGCETPTKKVAAENLKIDKLINFSGSDTIDPEHYVLIDEKDSVAFRFETEIERIDYHISFLRNDINTPDSTITLLEKEKAKLKSRLKEVQNASKENWDSIKHHASQTILNYETNMEDIYKNHYTEITY